ncbi:required for respiratory growth protein 9, mitochondrial [Aspergillus ambiguus]|uniref:mitochondrial ribosome assembly protein RRG9 n=1 Tax=Aspergillus ambiguus TaxID=176160 RepID=UPI003CCD22D2
MMVAFCARSTSLALPTVLRNVFRAELASELPSLGRHRKPANLRHFRSIPLNGSVQSRPLTSSTEPPATPRSQPHENTHHNEVSIEELTTRADTSNPTPADTPHTSPEVATMHKKSVEGVGTKLRLDNELKRAGPKPKKKKEGWQIQKDALRRKFRDGWNPPKKLSPDALEGIRHLNAVAPDRFTTPVLAEQFGVSPEAIRRILKSKWRASEEELEDRRKRWERRHDRIWGHLSELGLRPKTKRTDAFSDTNVLYDARHKRGK